MIHVSQCLLWSVRVRGSYAVTMVTYDYFVEVVAPKGYSQNLTEFYGATDKCLMLKYERWHIIMSQDAKFVQSSRL